MVSLNPSSPKARLDMTVVIRRVLHVKVGAWDILGLELIGSCCVHEVGLVLWLVV